MKLTIRELAILEEVTKRQILRYCNEGYQGHVLKASPVGNRLLVEERDYRQWRIDCGFDHAQPEPKPEPQHQVETIAPEPEPTPIGPSARLRPSDPNAPLTNVPYAHSSNWPAPEVLREHYEEKHRQMVRELLGGKSK